MTDYNVYHYSLKELIFYLSMGLLLDGIISYLFYRSLLAFLIFSPLIIFFLRNEKKQLIIKRKYTLTLQFREAIIAISSSLNAGYSIENAFIESISDLSSLYGDDSLIVIEFKQIVGRLASNETLESILQDFATRSGIEDIQDFTDIFVTAKRSGGDMNSIIRKTVYHISEKIEVNREITTLISSKKNGTVYYECNSLRYNFLSKSQF